MFEAFKSLLSIELKNKTKNIKYALYWTEKTHRRLIGFLTSVLSLLDAETGVKAPMCSDQAMPVKCGISRIWVLPEFR